jgi:RNase H-fold protein (predicted Holliday junction resolvase)
VRQLGAAGVSLPVVAWDERGTSAAARAVLRAELGQRRAVARPPGAARTKSVHLPLDHAAKVDEMAAVLLLESFCGWAAGHAAAAGRSPLARAPHHRVGN